MDWARLLKQFEFVFGSAVIHPFEIFQQSDGFSNLVKWIQGAIYIVDKNYNVIKKIPSF
jgi:hypothetical protein